MLNRIMAGLIVSVVISGGATAGPLEDADAAWRRGDFAALKTLAELGVARAQFYVGMMYDLGPHLPSGVPQNIVEEAKWYREAAEQGDAEAQASLGALYEHGAGVPQDYAEAVKWDRKAAEQGDGGGQFLLGGLYEKGLGVPEDYVIAYMWCNLAAAQANPLAGDKRDVIAKLMTPDQIAEAQRMAREWKPTPAK